MEHKEDNVKSLMKDLLDDGFVDGGHSQGERHPKEIDSPDDFEHLGHDTSPLGDIAKSVRDATGKLLRAESPTRQIPGVIDNGSSNKTGVVDEIARTAAGAASKLADEFATGGFDPFARIEHKFDSSLVADQPLLFDSSDNKKMDSNLLEMGDTIPTKNVAEEKKMDKFLDELTAFTTSPKLADLTPEKELKKDDYKTTVQNFVDAEREDRYSDSEDDFKQTTDEEFVRKTDNASPVITGAATATSVHKTEAFQDVEEDDDDDNVDDENDYDVRADYYREKEPPMPEKYDVFEPQPFKVPEPFKAPEVVRVQEPQTPDASETYKPFDDFVEIGKAKPAQPDANVGKKAIDDDDVVIIKPPESVVETPRAKPEKIGEDVAAAKDVQPKKVESKSTAREVIGAEAIFCKMGLVESLIYWRDPKKSGPVFGGVLVVLLALTYFSLISVIAYVSLFALTGTIFFRIYKNVLHAVQKTGDGHPFKQYLETDVSLSQEKVKEIGDVAVAHINAIVRELRRLFLVEDLVDSIKFGVLMWCLTYLGAWFNGMTLIIIGWVALFTLPKVYETNKTQIDANLDIVRSKLAEITNKVKAAVPIGKKPEEKKEQ